MIKIHRTWKGCKYIFPNRTFEVAKKVRDKMIESSDVKRRELLLLTQEKRNFLFAEMSRKRL